MVFTTTTAQQTEAVGQALAGVLTGGSVIAYEGDIVEVDTDTGEVVEE